ncbi:MAG: PHP domain-containing protein [Spirochaetota bacterium]
MVDLHAHSTCSDGTLTPTELVREARRLSIRVLALTDHDTIEGVPEAVEEANRGGVTLIPGIELEIAFRPGIFHMLGLGLTDVGHDFSASLGKLREKRTQRNLRMVDKLRHIGIPADYDDISREAGGTVVGRPHFARYLVSIGAVKDIREAFYRYLGDGKQAYEPKPSLPVEEATALIHSVGGKAVVAHPMTLGLSLSDFDEALSEWKEYGLDGVEAYHSNAKWQECLRLERLAAKHGLIATAGSDYHGPYRTDRALGRTAGGRIIEDRFAAPFLEHLN